MIVQWESSNMFYEKKAGKECATVPEEGRRGSQIGHKKTHSFERTHVLDSKVTLTHHERNDAGREREGERVRARRKTNFKR